MTQSTLRIGTRGSPLALAQARMVLRPDGSEAFKTTRAGKRSDAVALGADAGAELKRRAPPDFFAA